MNSENLTTALGRAVAAVWADLPAAVQHDLFESAIRLAGPDTRGPLASFLHRVHPRTTDTPVRAVPEPDSLGG